jgi:DNA-binding transcriptional MerR regulator
VAQLQSYSKASWSAEEFVQVVNRLLPEFLPDIGFNQKIREEVNLRLIRHYTSIGAVDEPGKLGKESRYSYRHLLQLLLVRRLLAQGYSSGSIDQFPKRQSNDELLALLQDGQPSLPRLLSQERQGDSALDFLDSVRKRTNASSRSARASSDPNSWSRIQLCPGLELQIQSGFVPPRGSQLVALLGQITDLIRNPPR